jgi:hypothetical protein
VATLVCVGPVAHMPCRAIGLKPKLTAPNETLIGGTDRKGPTLPAKDPIVRPVLKRTLNGASVGLRRPPTKAAGRLLILTRYVRLYVIRTVSVEDDNSVGQPWNDIEVVHNRKCSSHRRCPNEGAVLPLSGHHLAVRKQSAVMIAVCVVAGLLSSCSAGSDGESPPSPSPSRSADAVPAVVANCENPKAAPQRRPNRIVAACGGDAVFILSGIRYSSWSARSAFGTARVKYNSCRPYCAAGHLVAAKARFRLNRPRQFQGHLVFTSLFVQSQSGPDGKYPLLAGR